MPAEELAVAIGGLFGAMIAAFGAVGLIGWRVWRGLSHLIKGTALVEADLTEALGRREPENDGPGVPSRTHPHRRETGIFALAVRTEIKEQVEPLRLKVDSMESTLTDLQSSADSQAELLAELARQHNDLVGQSAEPDTGATRRQHEESAARNLAAAAETMTRAPVVSG